MCSGSGAVTSMIPRRGCGRIRRRAKRCSLGSSPGGTRARGPRAGIVGGTPIVFRIANDRVADRFAMGAELMRPAGDRAHRQPCEARRNLVDDRIEGQRVLRVGITVLGDPHPLEIRPALPRARAHAFALGEKHGDAPLRRLGHALDQRPIDLLRLRASGRSRQAPPPSCAIWRSGERPTCRGRADGREQADCPALSASA